MDKSLTGLLALAIFGLILVSSILSFKMYKENSVTISKNDIFPDFVAPYNHCLLIYASQACKEYKGCNFDKADTMCSKLLKDKKQ